MPVPTHSAEPKLPAPRVVLLGLALLAGLGMVLCFLLFSERTHRPGRSVTFNAQIAPIIYRECTGCHQPGQSAPFPLVTYEQVAKHARQIAKVTTSRYMPPWLPEHGYGDFADQRYLSDGEIALLQRWVAQGAKEGDAPMPPAPALKANAWALGQPDMIVALPDTYTLPPEGRDIYRNFVIPVPLEDRRLVRAIEVQPGSKAVHHLFVLVDRTGNAARRDREDAEPGFPGMALPPSVESPGGYFLSWQPGRAPIQSEPGMAWTLKPRSDLVLQMHMQPTGKPEAIRPAIAFYFTDRAPTNAPFKLGLSSYAIDIPPGASNYLVEESYTLPSNLSLLSILPHAHYLGNKIESYAILPGGETNWLLNIPHWDFNWQSAYRYSQPVPLPKGSQLVMRISYDNSTNNIHNPHHPPIRVQYGLQTTDEMAGVIFQMLALNPAEREAFDADYQKYVLKDVINLNTLLLKRNPQNAHAHVQLAKACLIQGETAAALEHLNRAVQINPDEDEAHYHLGLIAMDRNDLPRAIVAFSEAIRINPGYVKARNNLGLIFMAQGRFAAAEEQFKLALQTAPDDPFVLSNIALLDRKRGAAPATH